MKKILNSIGWQEVTTKNIEITLKVNKNTCTTGTWTKHCIQHPKMNKGGRKRCDRCGLVWSECPPETPTFFCHSTKGNKIVCQKCFDELDVKSV